MRGHDVDDPYRIAVADRRRPELVVDLGRRRSHRSGGSLSPSPDGTEVVDRRRRRRLDLATIAIHGRRIGDQAAHRDRELGPATLRTSAESLTPTATRLIAPDVTGRRSSATADAPRSADRIAPRRALVEGRLADPAGWRPRRIDGTDAMLVARPARPSEGAGRRRPRRVATIARMAHRVTLIPGDGIGPELAEATTPRPRRDRHRLRVGVRRGRRGGDRPSTGRRSRSTSSSRSGATRSRSRARSRHRSAEGFRSVNVTLRQALGLYANLRPARSMQGLEIALRGRRPRHRPREHRGPVRRHRAHGRPRCRREHQDHHPRRVRADRPLRLRVRGRQRPAQGHGRPQGQHHEAVRRPVPRELPDGRGRVRRAGSSSRTASSTTCACSSSRSPSCTTCSSCRTSTATSSATLRPGWSAGSASRRAPTSAPRRPSSSRSTARRPSTPGSTRPTRPR